MKHSILFHQPNIHFIGGSFSILGVIMSSILIIRFMLVI